MKKRYILALDQGTTSSRSLLIDREGSIAAISQKEFRQIFPHPGWVEHDPLDIWSSQWETVEEVLALAGIDFDQIAAIGITNQRETVVVWDKNTGEPVYNAIVWQDKRTAGICEDLKNKGFEEYVKSSTGLVIDSYFSATKIKWILDNVEGARGRAERGDLLFGTVDTWLVWKLTKGMSHVTDYTNASRTMLFHIERLSWDRKLLQALDVPEVMMPGVLPSSADFGEIEIKGSRIPVCGLAGDQQAALFGQACLEPGMAKNTYGTGCFMLLHTGSKKIRSEHGLVSTLACSTTKEPEYALEGSVFIAGAAIQWLRDGLKLINSAADSEIMAEEASGSDEVFVVPAFVGLGAPYWDMYARGAIFGLTRDTSVSHIVKGTLDSLAYQTRDVLEAMSRDSGLDLKCLKVDGGAVANNYLMQFQADILDVPVERPEVVETTAMGAAYLAGIRIGWWTKESIASQRKIERVFNPDMVKEKRDLLYTRWKEAVKRTIGWSKTK